MPDIRDLFPPSRFKAADLSGPSVVVLKSTLFERPGYNGTTEYAIEFELDGRRCVTKVGDLLAKDIGKALGITEADLWPEHQVVFYPDDLEIKAEGKWVKTIRASEAPSLAEERQDAEDAAAMREANGTGKASPQPVQQQQAKSPKRGDMDDDIPF